jgi:hypothetical protein
MPLAGDSLRAISLRAPTRLPRVVCNDESYDDIRIDAEHRFYGYRFIRAIDTRLAPGGLNEISLMLPFFTRTMIVPSSSTVK